jgi:hypothetical protein
MPGPNKFYFKVKKKQDALTFIMFSYRKKSNQKMPESQKIQETFGDAYPIFNFTGCLTLILTACFTPHVSRT